jgi:hypothetical protein
MTCSTSSLNGSIPVVGGAAARHGGVVHVERREIGQGAAAPILELDPAGPFWPSRQVVVSAVQGLQLGRLVRADDVLIRAQLAALPAPVVEVQYPLGLGREVRVAWEDPRAVLPRLDRISGQPALDCRAGQRVGDATGDGLGGQIRAGPAGQRQPVLGR